MFTLDLFFDFTNFFFLSKVQQDAPSPYEKYTRRQRHYSLSRTQSVRETSTDLGARYARSPVRIPSVLCAVVRAFTLEMRTPA